MRNNNRLHKYVPSLLLFLLFETVAVALWLAKGNLFYLLNFSYIGGCLGVGTALFAAGKRYARQFVQWAVGSYMLLYLGVLSHENMQIEGFWYYLFLGVFEAATIHYAVAKIFGPLVFGRGWCGYACWTAMVLDLLPYKIPQAPRKKLGFLRYITFAASFVYVAALFLMAEIAVLRTHIVNYARTRPVYDAYRKAGYSKRFLDAHREEITLHKAAKVAFNDAKLTKLPKVKDLNIEYADLLAKKKSEYPAYRKARDEMQELMKAQKNVEMFFAEEKSTTEKEQTR